MELESIYDTILGLLILAVVLVLAIIISCKIDKNN